MSSIENSKYQEVTSFELGEGKAVVMEPVKKYPQLLAAVLGKYYNLYYILQIFLKNPCDRTVIANYKIGVFLSSLTETSKIRNVTQMTLQWW